MTVARLNRCTKKFPKGVGKYMHKKGLWKAKYSIHLPSSFSFFNIHAQITSKCDWLGKYSQSMYRVFSASSILTLRPPEETKLRGNCMPPREKFPSYYYIRDEEEKSMQPQGILCYNMFKSCPRPWAVAQICMLASSSSIVVMFDLTTPPLLYT